MADAEIKDAVVAEERKEVSEVVEGSADAPVEEKLEELSDEVKSKILKQVEYYFSDSNYPVDKFLRAKASENGEGWVAVEVLTTFNRLAALSKHVPTISSVIKQSTKLELSDDGKMLRRVDPIPEDLNFESRSVYAKGWPLENTTVDTVEEYFTAKGYAVRSVRLRRRHPSKVFKGSVFVELSTEEEAQKCRGEKHEVGGVELLMYMKQEYHAVKKEEFAAKKKDRMEKKKGKDEAKGKREEEEKEAAAAIEKEIEEREYTKGLILSLEQVGAECTRELLKEIFAECGNISYVDFSRGEPNAFVRFEEEGSAQKGFELVQDKKTEVAGIVPTPKVLEGDEEKEYWIALWKRKEAKIAAIKGKKKQGRGGYRGGRGGGRGRGGKRKFGGGDRGGKKARTE